MTLRETLDRIRSQPDPSNEISALAQIILPILGALGWDTTDPYEVRYQFTKDELSKLTKEKISINLNSQMISICSPNGLEWWLHLLPEKGASQDRAFATIMVKKDPIKKVLYNLKTFLSKENLISGHSLKTARGILEYRKLAVLLAKELPIIWRSMLSKPDNKLVDLIMERTHEKLEFYPRKSQVEAIIKATKLEPENSHESDDPRSSTQNSSIIEPYKKPTRIRLLGVYHNVKYWKDILIQIAETLYQRHTNTFDQILNLHPENYRPYAARNYKALRKPRLIGSSKIYLETNLSAEYICERANLFLKHFGYDPPEDYLQILYD